MKLQTTLRLVCLAAVSAAQTSVTAPMPPPDGMELLELAVSGNTSERVNLAFFSDGYTRGQRDKFVADAKRLTADILTGGPMNDVAHLLNVWGVFVASNTSGLGKDSPLPGAPFGLYRDGAELRGVYAGHQDVARAACRHFGEQCDQPILLGNDPLYGGLGGEFTIITASEINGPQVLRHELGHSLIEVGEEYDGGYVYDGVNAEIVENLHNLSWAGHLSNPADVRIEDLKVPIQAYPWHDLDKTDYSRVFTPTKGDGYDTALMRLSLSSIPVPEHIEVSIGGVVINLTSGFPDEYRGSLDRRWVEITLPHGLGGVVDIDRANPANVTFAAKLTAAGHAAKAGQGGKMISSAEIIEYGAKCNLTSGYIGAFPSYAINGSVTLRPMNEECIMRRVTYEKFCPVCAEGLKNKLEGKIAAKNTARL